MDGTVDNLLFLRNQLPAGSTYSVTGIGSASVPMLMAALAMGADGIRVGLEDNLYMSKGVPATNVSQVERAVKLVELANRRSPPQPRLVSFCISLNAKEGVLIAKYRHPRLRRNG